MRDRKNKKPTREAPTTPVCRPVPCTCGATDSTPRHPNRDRDYIHGGHCLQRTLGSGVKMFL